MGDGHRALTLRVDYSELHKTSPQAARQAVGDDWKNNGDRIGDVADGALQLLLLSMLPKEPTQGPISSTRSPGNPRQQAERAPSFVVSDSVI